MRIIATIVMLAWGLWFGGIVMVMLAANSLFQTFGTDRMAAGMAATGIFHRFEVYQLILAAVAIGATLLWRRAPRMPRRGLLICLAAAALCAIAMTAYITPQLEDMRVVGRTDNDEFRRMHMVSVAAYLAETALLLLAGIFAAMCMRSGSIASDDLTPPATHTTAAAPAPAVRQ
jgi:glucan phosphoethanolaminetransferase (alkaline phosphatase superfamily)